MATKIEGTEYRAADLPEGSEVRHAGRTYRRDRASSDGWWSPPEGYYMDQEIDRLLNAGAVVLRVGTGQEG
jgi:hypothetical protein